MNAVEKPTFETAAHEHIYECVEREGAVPRDELGDRIVLDVDSVAERAAELVRERYLIDIDGTLELGLGGGGEREVGAVTIRPGRQQELSALVDTIRRVIEDAHYPSADALVVRLERERVLKRHGGTDTRIIFLAVTDGGIVGWVHLGADATQRVRRTAELTVGVRADHRDRGIGSGLLQRGTEWGTRHGFRAFRQRIARTNDSALAFLDGHGWEKEAIRQNQFAGDGGLIDEVVMVTR